MEDVTELWPRRIMKKDPGRQKRGELLVIFLSLLWHSLTSANVIVVESHSSRVGLLDLANENIGHPVKFEFQVNDELFFNIKMSHVIFDVLILENSWLFYLKFKVD